MESARILADKIFERYENSLGRHPDGNDDPSIDAARYIEADRAALLREAAERITEDILNTIRGCVIQEPCEGCQQVGFWLTDEAATALVAAAITTLPPPESGKEKVE